jgi:hypothetical protein
MMPALLTRMSTGGSSRASRAPSALTASRSPRSAGHRIADAPALDARAERGDAAGHLMPDDRGDGDATIHRAVPDVQVGPADAHEGDIEAHLALRRLRRLSLGDGEGAVADIGRGEHG